MNTVKSLVTVSIAFLLLVGCAERQRFKAAEQICAADLDKAAAMQAAEEVLGQMHFAVEKADAEQGLIRSRPLQGAQFFELWRSDNVGSFNAAEANLHTIRRVAELDISQQGGQLCIGCNVKTQRLSLPEHKVASSSQAYGMFSASTPSMQKLKLHSEQKKDMTWVDLGRDARLETEILKRLEGKIAELQ